MKKATFDPAKRLDLYFRINRNGSKAFVFKNSEGEARSLAYEEFEFNIKEYSGGRISISIPLTISENILTAEITEALSRVNEGEYYYELIRSDIGKTWLNGKAIFHNGVFDGVDNDTEDITISETGETIEITVMESGTGGSGPVYTSGNAIEVDEENAVNLGNQFTKNTSIPGNEFNVELGTTDSRLNRFLFRVADLFEVLMPTGGTWRAIVGTSQLLVNNVAIGMLHNKLIQFQDGASNAVLNIITENDGDIIVPSIQAKVPIAPPIVYVQSELDALDVTKYNGHLVFKDFSSSISRIKQPIYSDGAAWRYIIQLLDIDGVTTPQEINGSGQPAARLPIGEGNTEANMTIKMTVAFELLSATISALADFISGDLTLLTITKTTPGIYLLKMEAILLSGNRWMLTGTVTGPGDVNISGALYFEKDPAEFFDLFVTGGCASSGQFSRLYWYYEKQSY
jgi:hypothetical protein